ncbi:MAG: DUF4013 domain-containing protein [ANME-2 cluster archaeon]|nr:DUF4013 domain-containing protein [ANME-2 cluster archaeon]
MDIVETVKFPGNDVEWIKKILIGGLLMLIPIVNFIALGYYIKTLRGSIDDESALPEWEDWGDLFIKGLVVVIVVFIYMLIPLAILFFSIGSAAISSIASGDVAPASIGAIIAGSLISMVLVFIACLLLPMAFSMYAKEDSIGAAFRLGELLSRIRSIIGEYIIALIVLLALMVIVSFISMVPFIGWVVMIFANFYVGLVAAYMLGNVYAASSA